MGAVPVAAHDEGVGAFPLASRQDVGPGRASFVAPGKVRRAIQDEDGISGCKGTGQGPSRTAGKADQDDGGERGRIGQESGEGIEFGMGGCAVHVAPHVQESVPFAIPEGPGGGGKGELPGVLQLDADPQRRRQSRSFLGDPG